MYDVIITGGCSCADGQPSWIGESCAEQSGASVDTRDSAAAVASVETNKVVGCVDSCLPVRSQG